MLSRRPFFKRHPSTVAVDCAQILRNDGAYIQEYAKRRVALNESASDALRMDCGSIRERRYFPDAPLSDAEADFSLAQARIVYKTVKVGI